MLICKLGLREIYKLLGTHEANKIVKLLLNGPIRSTQLMEKSHVPESKFHPLIRALLQCQVLEKQILSDRGVPYSISPFGKNVLELSEPILEKIREVFKDKVF